MIVEFSYLKGKFYDMIPRRILQFSENVVQDTKIIRDSMAIERAQGRYNISRATWH